MKAFFHTVLYQPLYNLLILLAWIAPGHSIGWAIIVLTVIIRLILLPSSIKAAHLQVKNMEIQPKVNKIRSEIKDQKAQSEALMALYKEENFSPFGSCLPILIQLPILWVLFAVFRSGLNTDGFKDLYSFIPHASSINTMFLGFDLVLPDKWILPIVAGLLQFYLSWLMMPKKKPEEKRAEDKAAEQNDPTAMMSKQMLFLPSVITIFFGRTMPAALVLYWITTTVFGVFQQLYVNKEIQKMKESKQNDQPKVEAIKQVNSPEVKQIEKPKQNNMLQNMMNKRLDKQEKKSGVNVVVRSKGKN